MNRVTVDPVIKQIIFNLHGKKDGLDDERFFHAQALSAKSKLSSQMESLTNGEAFVVLRNLEDKGKIKFTIREVDYGYQRQMQA